MKTKEYTSMKYKHSAKFYKTRYNKYKAEMKKLGLPPMKEGSFISTYDAIAEKAAKSKTPVKVNPMKEIIYSARYGTNYNSAIAEKAALAKAGIKAKLEDLKKMTTQEFADKYATELYNTRRQLLAAGKTKSEVNLLISQQWFGSK